MIEQSRVFWRRLDTNGSELSVLLSTRRAWRLMGGVLVEMGERGHRIDYRVDILASWKTRSATIEGLIGGRERRLTLQRDTKSRWTRDGERIAALDGCVDIDFGFSPATNILPIRRLRLAIGESADVRAAWVKFPELTLEVLEQRYRRTGEHAYHYESAGGKFQRELTVNGEGFVIDYPGLWIAE